ncbi:hypothetical protein DSO57_1004945 [Entomophthora muscae]|uniref:Uncharacterized protein n=1 Tax=Entomophthora muscae TaxID=34485 RepID=A0ACC2T7T7_9FUNG|nr:hypothetical protein DSO57_1004945 [Entomophthora muscae]
MDDIRPASQSAHAGWYKYLVVLAGFCSMFSIYGTIYSYGLYLVEYDKIYGKSYGKLSFLVTTCSCISMILAPFSGKVADALGYRWCIFLGGELFALGLLLASISTEIWQLILTQGVLMGIGSAFVFIPAISAPATWFTERRGLATGIASTGSGIGGLVMPLLTQSSLEKHGVASTLRLTSLLCAIVFICAGLVLKTPDSLRSRPAISLSIFRDYRFCAFFIGEMFFAFGFLVPILLLPGFANHIQLPVKDGALALSILNFLSAGGRILFGFLADRLGAIHVIIFCSAAAALANIFIWPFSTDLPSLITFSVVYGLCSGGFVALVPITLASLFGVESMASTTGLVYFGSALPVLVGTPICRKILEVASSGGQKNYFPVQLYTGLVILGASMSFLCLRIFFYNRASSQ